MFGYLKWPLAWLDRCSLSPTARPTGMRNLAFAMEPGSFDTAVAREGALARVRQRATPSARVTRTTPLSSLSFSRSQRRALSFPPSTAVFSSAHPGPFSPSSSPFLAGAGKASEFDDARRSVLSCFSRSKRVCACDSPSDLSIFVFLFYWLPCRCNESGQRFMLECATFLFHMAWSEVVLAYLLYPFRV